jgi:Zn-dependent peptidase ImmA (M78 family)
MEKSNINRYNLNEIKSYRHLAIDKAVKRFKKTFALKDGHIDFINLAIKINNESKHKIYFKTVEDLPSNLPGVTIYLRETDTHLVSINTNQFCKSKKLSESKVNFTIAKQFGHNFLRHSEIPDSDKTDEIKMEEDLEAYAFAKIIINPSINNPDMPEYTQLPF